MATIKDLSERFGLSERQVRLRLTNLNGALQEFTQQGQYGRIQLTDGGVAIFERLIELERSGFGTTGAYAKLCEELKKSHSHESYSPTHTTVNVGQESRQPSSPQQEGPGGAYEALFENLKIQIEELRRDKCYLQTKLDEALAKVPALPAPRPVESQQQSMSRWVALRIALLGR